LINHPLLEAADIFFSDYRLNYISSPYRQVTSNAEYSWNYPHGSYDMMSYNKTATWLYTLMGIIGEETINDIFREYYRKWAFKHPSGKDFINVVNEVVKRDHGEEFGTDMNWFFDQTLYGTGICDYKVSDITNSRHRAPEGNKLTNETTALISLHPDSLYTSSATLQRIGEVMLPLDILIHFNNGDEVLEKWDGRARFKDFIYTGCRQILWVKIDPEYKIKMDANYINNSMTVEPDYTPLRSLFNKFIPFLQLFLSFILL
jgi:hypothetical protein